MQIIIQNPRQNLVNALRQCGYHFERHHIQTSEVSAAKNLGIGGFPRFHCYAKLDDDKNIVINLHLDQKRPSYAGTRTHGGEYDGELVRQEAERIKKLFEI
ncbi:MAG: hypothetical protein A3B96_03100 [Candidatus Spechtbacteria bacterium RIFCSPHIGHO2_02_FULL_43_15b]|uniref:Uncharacterized protein n=1 Tax=Candidatus Spechtbacteria bacterium RIFCSPHIGHO2_01_FULL_43_30 TaxID=1802158 RepID=A0A1G2H8X4_9BACT|nr:MAG: hypothetical protein A2827_00550 [Candidatus Spechtbacteria bacterium RIFCSPHIGHO2_01_FULL_43_30]OGZ59731.1 MAG: hypothetical protein A3B96_03100 [Candidatus Spechtbacteria bacterium RIFCSPHIGHO2_02_FULL_43_15b]